MSLASLLVNSVTITPVTQAANTYGSPVDTAGSAVTIAMSIQPQTSSRGIEFDRVNGQRRATGYALYSDKANLVNGSKVSFDGQTWKIDGSWRNVAGRGEMVEVDLVEFVQ